MTRNRFADECTERCILAEVAIENEKIQAALKAKNDKEVLRLLDTEF